jgi:hypothetical protein
MHSFISEDLLFHLTLANLGTGTGSEALLHPSPAALQSKVPSAAHQTSSLYSLPLQISSSYTTTTSTTAPPSGGLQNGGEKLEKTIDDLGEDIRPEMKEDIHDPSYQDEEGPPPKLEYVWRNIILMGLLHVGALYGLTLVPTCKFYTWLWGKQLPLP